MLQIEKRNMSAELCINYEEVRDTFQVSMMKLS